MGCGMDAGSIAKPLILPKTKVVELLEQEWKPENPVKKTKLSAISEKKKIVKVLGEKRNRALLWHEEPGRKKYFIYLIK